MQQSLLTITFQLGITIHIVKGIFDGITTAELDEYAANYSSTLAAEHPDFAVLAGRIAVSNLQKQTSKVFSDVIEQLYNHVDVKNGERMPLVADDVYNIVMTHKEVGFGFYSAFCKHYRTGLELWNNYIYHVSLVR